MANLPLEGPPWGVHYIFPTSLKSTLLMHYKDSHTWLIFQESCDKFQAKHHDLLISTPDIHKLVATKISCWLVRLFIGDLLRIFHLSMHLCIPRLNGHITSKVVFLKCISAFIFLLKTLQWFPIIFMRKSKPLNMVYDIPPEMAFTASSLAISFQTIFLPQTQNCLMKVLTVEWLPLSCLK